MSSFFHYELPPPPLLYGTYWQHSLGHQTDLLMHWRSGIYLLIVGDAVRNSFRRSRNLSCKNLSLVPVNERSVYTQHISFLEKWWSIYRNIQVSNVPNVPKGWRNVENVPTLTIFFSGQHGTPSPRLPNWYVFWELMFSQCFQWKKWPLSHFYWSVFHEFDNMMAP